MDAHTDIFKGAAINGTISTDMGILSPASVSSLTWPTAMGWGEEYSAQNGAMAIFSVPTGVSLSLVAVSLVMKER